MVARAQRGTPTGILWHLAEHKSRPYNAKSDLGRAVGVRWPGGVVGGVVWSYDALLASRQKHAVTWAQLRSQGIVIAVKSGRNSPVDGMRKDRSWRSRGDKRICSTFPRLKQKRTFYETKLFFYRHTCLILYFKVNFTQRDQCSISTVVLRHAPL